MKAGSRFLKDSKYKIRHLLSLEVSFLYRTLFVISSVLRSTANSRIYMNAEAIIHSLFRKGARNSLFLVYGSFEYRLRPSIRMTGGATLNFILAVKSFGQFFHPLDGKGGIGDGSHSYGHQFHRIIISSYTIGT